ncbi:MAG: hypothetical protein ACFCBU_03150 [Cyanophyceae cyanobacterium]
MAGIALTLLLGACGSAEEPTDVSVSPSMSEPSPVESPELEGAADQPEEGPEAPKPKVPEGWVPYIAPDKSFAIAFPEEPEQQTIPNMSAKYDGGSRFYFARADYPEPPPQRPSQNEVREYLELVMPGLARAFGGDRIDYWEGMRLSGHEGRRMVFRNERGIQFETRFFFDAVQGRLFVATFGLTDDNIAVPDAKAFFESFKISP